MNTYTIPIIWEMIGWYDVQAESLDEAISETKHLPLPEGSYIEGSAKIDESVYDEYDEE